MPIYEYRCQSCEDTFEVLQKFSDEPLTSCEKCGGKLERLLSPPGLQFKGTGWYVTDYARKSSGDGRDGKGKAEGDGKTESSKERASSSSSKD